MEDLQGIPRNSQAPWCNDVVTAAMLHRQDAARVEYLQGYLSQMHKAISKGVEVKGYLATWRWKTISYGSYVYGGPIVATIDG